MPIERKLAAIMFTDIAGYTALSAKDSTKASELLKTQRDTLKPIVEKHGGSWMKEMGDGLLLTFDSATSAVECSIAIQVATKDIEDLNLRIGIHEGEVIKQDGDVIGDDVNVASRIEPFSAVGGVAISDKIYRAISSNQDFETKYIGKPKLKGVAQEVKVYCITSHGLPETDVSKVSAKLEEESKFNIFALTGGILTAIGIAFWIAVGIFDVSFGGKTEVPSIAIIPFDNKGADEDEFYAYSISSELISDVTSAGLIRVAGLKDIEKLEYQTLNYSELSEKLLVRYIAQGTLWKIDSVFQLSMELYDTKTSKVLWSESWQKAWNELPSIKGNLADNILKTLKVSTKQDIAKVPTSNTEAYEYYLRANYIYDKRKDMKDIEIARGLYQKAIELDDNLIKAKNSLGWTYYGTGDYDKAMKIYTPALKQSEELGDKYGMGSSLISIGTVYNNKGDYEKALDYYNRSLIIKEEIGDKYGMGTSLINIGSVYADKGDYEKALDYHERSLAIAEEIGDKRGMGSSLNSIGNVHINKGDYEKALDYYNRSLIIKEELGDKSGMGMSLNNIGNVHSDKGDYEKALDYHERSLAIAEEIGDKRGMGSSLNSIGNVHINKGDYEKALDYYNRSLIIKEELGDKSGMGMSLNNIGNVHSDKGDYEKALDYHERSLAIAEEIGDKRWMGISLNSIGTVYNNKGDYEKALDYYNRSLIIKEEIGDKYGMGTSLINIGSVYADKGDYEKALDYHERSLAIAEEIGDKRWMGISLNSIGTVYNNKGDYEKALDYYNRSLIIKEELGDKSGMGMSLNNIGNVHIYKGDLDKALNYYEKALAIREEIGDKYGMGISLISIGTVYAEKGDYESAEEYLKKSLVILREIGLGDNELLASTVYLYLSYKNLGKKYDVKEIHSLIKDTENIEFELNYAIYQLLEDTSYLETAYNQVKEKADNLEPDVAAKFLSYPIPKAIVEEWEKVK